MNKANECTCPSGDGSLRHPCPAHPAPVEHAGGDERDVQGAQGERQAFEAHESRERRLSPADQKFWFRRGAVADYDIKSIDDAWKAWKARAALAQPALQCKKCGGTGDADSGGIHPWGETAMVPCDCAHTERAQGKRTEDGDTIIDRLRLGGLTIDGDNAYKRDLLDCVVGALAFGFQGRPAPEETHWLHRFWEIGNAEREARAALAQPSQSQYEASFEEWLANELEGEDGHPVPAAVCDIALARRAFNHWPKLEQPAKVGGVRFSAGVSSRLVVEAAQRLYEFESTPEKEAERIEQLQAFREQLDPLNLAPHAEAFNEAPDEALRPEQAEAERSALWAVHAQGPDELYAAFSREDAEKHAAELNALPMPEGIAVGAVVVPSPWPAVQHWQYLAEQEQDHKNEIAGRLRQHERIGEALRAEIAEWQEAAGRSRSDVVAYIAERAKLLEERDTALTKVAELEKELEMARDAASKGDAARHAACGMEMDIQELKAKLADPTAVHQWQFSNAWFDGSEEAVLKAGKEGSPIRTLYAAPPAQAQHSVPIAPELKRALGLVVAALEADGDRPTSKYALSELKKVLAAAPGKEGV